MNEMYLFFFCICFYSMEESISNSRIQLSNTSSSYAQYLESLPNNYTREYDKIAQIVLKASKYLLNNNCKQCVLILMCVCVIFVVKQFKIVFLLKFLGPEWMIRNVLMLYQHTDCRNVIYSINANI